MSAAIAASTGAKLGLVGQAFYFHPDTLARGRELGLDGFRFYALGRGGVLGDVEPAVIESAFGYFHGGLIAKIYGSAKERVEPRVAASAYMECARARGRAVFGDLDLAAFNEAAVALREVIHPAALALYAGTAAEPMVGEEAADAMQHAVVLREWRGSVHLVALVAEQLPVDRAHLVKRPDDYASFGYAEEPAPVTDDERDRHARAELRTDEICGEAIARLSSEQQEAYVAGVDAMHAAIV